MSGSAVFDELGPTMPSAAVLYTRARKARELMQIVTEIALPGPRQDVARAERLIAEARAVLGPAYEDAAR